MGLSRRYARKRGVANSRGGVLDDGVFCGMIKSGKKLATYPPLDSMVPDEFTLLRAFAGTSLTLLQWLQNRARIFILRSVFHDCVIVFIKKEELWNYLL